MLLATSSFYYRHNAGGLGLKQNTSQFIVFLHVEQRWPLHLWFGQFYTCIRMTGLKYVMYFKYASLKDEPKIIFRS
jgi:hypothetical protein